MEQTIELFNLNRKRCAFYRHGCGGPCFLYAAGSMQELPPGEEMKLTVNTIRSFLEKSFEGSSEVPAYSLFIFEVQDWDGEYSPWSCEMQDYREIEPPRVFAGRGRETLDWLLEEVVPWLKTAKELQTEPMILAGYSLAGLFAAWGFYEAGCFSGVIAASASFWYEGWSCYMAGAKAKKKSAAYLSLGGKEPSSKNPVMATIGKAYENQKKWMKADKNIEQVLFEWNPGGHFADAGIRIAKGIFWFLKRSRIENNEKE